MNLDGDEKTRFNIVHIDIGIVKRHFPARRKTFHLQVLLFAEREIVIYKYKVNESSYGIR